MSDDVALPLEFTDAAANKVKSLIADEDNPNLKLRVYITGGGCSGFQYGFTFDDQAELANLAEAAQTAGHTVVISNHDTPLTRKIYAGAELDSIQVGRSISQKGSSRGKVAELFAIYRQK